VVAAQRKEALAISPAEQAANLAAVAHAPAPAGPVRRSGRIAAAAAAAPAVAAPVPVPAAPAVAARRSARLAASR